MSVPAPLPLPGTRTLALIESFLDTLVAERNAARNTRAAYQRDLLAAARFLAARAADLASANEDELRAYLQSLAAFAARTQARRLSALRQFFRYLCSEQHRKEDPTRAIDAPKLGRALPKYLSEEEVGLLLTTVGRMPGDEGSRLRALMELLYAAGLRAAEILSLRIEQLDLEAGSARVIGKGNKERLIPFSDELKSFNCRMVLEEKGCQSEYWTFLSSSLLQTFAMTVIPPWSCI